MWYALEYQCLSCFYGGSGVSGTGTEIGHRLEGFEIDGVLDSGVIEQLTEEKWYSPFPQFQTTERPDRAAMAVLEGRVDCAF